VLEDVPLDGCAVPCRELCCCRYVTGVGVFFLRPVREGQRHDKESDALFTGAAGRGGGVDGLCGGGVKRCRRRRRLPLRAKTAR
jgi:hypothetical protein